MCVSRAVFALGPLPAAAAARQIGGEIASVARTALRLVSRRNREPTVPSSMRATDRSLFKRFYDDILGEQLHTVVYQKLTMNDTYHSRLIPEGVAETSPIFLRDTQILLKLLNHNKKCQRDTW
jgi:hypothetical protein